MHAGALQDPTSSWIRAVASLSAATVRSSWKTPAPWAFAAVGLLLLWAGVTLDVLAVSGEARALEIGMGTAEGMAVLLAVWTVVRTIEVDRSGGLGTALDASSLGHAGRLLARWKGAVLVASSAVLPTIAAGVAFACTRQSHGDLWLYSASIIPLLFEVALAGAWAFLAARWVRPVPAVLVGLATFVLGRALQGGAPDVLVACLPRPVDLRAPFAAPLALAAEVVACGGVLLLALARPSAAQVD